MCSNWNFVHHYKSYNFPISSVVWWTRLFVTVKSKRWKIFKVRKMPLRLGKIQFKGGLVSILHCLVITSTVALSHRKPHPLEHLFTAAMLRTLLKEMHCVYSTVREVMYHVCHMVFKHTSITSVNVLLVMSWTCKFLSHRTNTLGNWMYCHKQQS